MLQDDRLNRRSFIGAGSTALALAAVPVSWGLFADPPRPFRAIYDERFAAGRAFSAEAVSRGWTIRAIRGDVTAVWFRELAPRWRTGPAMIAGVTTPQSLFVLERLAWDAGMRVIRRDSEAMAPVIRWVIGLPELRGRRS
jgi:hypothetical protein